MKANKMIMNAILISIGIILHQITPAMGIQADLSLAMLFIIMVYNKDYKTTLICGVIVGIFTALTTKTPNGQIPNILDKIITSNVMYVLLLTIRNKVNKNVQILISIFVGTFLSGTVFLLALITMGGLPIEQFSVLIVSIVSITALINCIVGFILFKVIEKTMRITGTVIFEK